jgi:hypothetical protein
MHILIADAFDAKLPERLAAFGTVSSDLATLPQAQVLLVRSKTKVDADLIAKAPNLKLVIRGGVGMDNVDKKLCAEKGIKAVNTPRASSVAVAEMAMAFMVAIPARLIEAHTSMKEGKFLKSELKRTELFKKTLGLIGAGNIATEVAKRAQAFGMEVIAFDPFLKEHPIARLVSLDELAAKADVISMHTPLTDDTKGMVNAAFIAKMKDGVILINTGRGKCVVTPIWPPPSRAASSGPTARTCGPAIRPRRTARCSAPPMSSWPRTWAPTPRKTWAASATRWCSFSRISKRKRSSFVSEGASMTHRVINFYAGPAGLPLPALERAQAELLDFAGTGMSVMEISHRAKEYDAVHEEAIALTKELMGLPSNYKVLMLQGGAHLSFGMIPLNLLRGGRKADYIVTGNWAEKATKEAKLVGGDNVRVAASTKDLKFSRLPFTEEIKVGPTVPSCTSPPTTPWRAPSGSSSPRSAACPTSAT